MGALFSLLGLVATLDRLLNLWHGGRDELSPTQPTTAPLAIGLGTLTLGLLLYLTGRRWSR